MVCRILLRFSYFFFSDETMKYSCILLQVTTYCGSEFGILDHLFFTFSEKVACQVAPTRDFGPRVLSASLIHVVCVLPSVCLARTL